MAEWRECSLESVCSRLSSGKGISAKLISESGVYPVYGGNGIRGYTDISNFKGECAIVGRQGAYCGNVRYFRGEAYMTEHAVVVCANEDNCTRYLAYLLATMNLGRLSGQSAQPGLSVKTLGKQEIRMPDKKVQLKCAELLGSLDEKISHNEEVNKNLLEQAQMIYQSWFIRYDPFGGKLPDDWKHGTLGEIAAIKTESWSPAKHPNTIVEHYSIPAFDEKRYPVFESSSEIKSNKYILTPESVMISKLNPNTKRIWRPLCLSKTPVCSTEFIVYEAKKESQRDFIFSIIDSVSFSNHLCAHVTGSTNSRQRAMPKTTLDFPVLIPTDDIITDFCNIVTPMYDLISSNIIENQSLAATRDSMLPKLMSGHLDISAFDF